MPEEEGASPGMILLTCPIQSDLLRSFTCTINKNGLSMFNLYNGACKNINTDICNNKNLQIRSINLIVERHGTSRGGEPRSRWR